MKILSYEMSYNKNMKCLCVCIGNGKRYAK